MKPYQLAIPSEQISCYGMEYDPISSKIMSFTTLRRGWHYGKGVPASPVIATIALGLLEDLRKQGVSKFEAFPDVSGGVLLSAYSGNICADVMIRPDFKINLVVEDGDDEIFEQKNISAEELIGLMGDKRWLSENSSDSFTLGTTATRRSDLNLWHLTSPAATPVFQFCSNAVFSTGMVTYANIYGKTTLQTSQATRPFSGDFPTMRFRHVA